MDFDYTLDIFCTNRPSLIDRCVPLPGISDHDIVLVDSSILPARKKPVKRKIYLWMTANKPAMDEDLTKFTQKLIEDNTTSTLVDTLWNRFKEKCAESINTHIPSKLTSTRFSKTWCNRDIRRLSRRKKRAYKKARTTKRQSSWSRYKKIQKEAQHQDNMLVERPITTSSVIWLESLAPTTRSSRNTSRA